MFKLDFGVFDVLENSHGFHGHIREHVEECVGVAEVLIFEAHFYCGIEDFCEGG